MAALGEAPRGLLGIHPELRGLILRKNNNQYSVVRFDRDANKGRGKRRIVALFSTAELALAESARLAREDFERREQASHGLSPDTTRIPTYSAYDPQANPLLYRPQTENSLAASFEPSEWIWE